MGPGGRLRPARTHRNGGRPEAPRQAGYPAPRGADTGVAMPTGGPPGIADTDEAIDVDQPYFEQLDPVLLAEPYDGVDADFGDAPAPPPVDAIDDDHAPDAAPGVAAAMAQVMPAVDGRPGPGQAPRPAVPPRSGDARGPQNGQQHAPRPQGSQGGGPDRPAGAPTCTAPQLRRFIKSRAYVPMHELRRRFAIVGADDDVSRIELEHGQIFVGLPHQEGQMLGELLRGGEVGFELSMDPETPIVVGVYAMRPVPRT
jgi:hypothetical protein